MINEAYVNSLKKGGKLKLTAKNRQNQDLTIEINLAGFTSVYDGDAALTFDEFTQGNARARTRSRRCCRIAPKQLRQPAGWRRPAATAPRRADAAATGDAATAQ